MKKTSAQQAIEKIKEHHTSCRIQFELNCSMILAGDRNNALRQEIIKELTGELLPKNKCSLHKVSEALQASFSQTSLF